MPCFSKTAFALVLAASLAAHPVGAGLLVPAVLFDPGTRAVNTWRAQAADNLDLTDDQAEAISGEEVAPFVARCVKLNNYWCIKKAGWDGEIAADGEGHVAFASAEAGAAVAALLLKRYYVDFGRKSATAIISHWAPAQCGVAGGGMYAGGGHARPRVRKGWADKAIAPQGLGNTLRAHWLAGHTRGFAVNVKGSKAPPVRRSVVADHIQRTTPTPTIAVGLGIPTKPMTLDALLRASPDAPPSRSMLGMPYKGHPGTGAMLGSLTGCSSDSARIAGYATKAAAGITTAPDGDLMLFAADGTPTPNLAIMMANMARVEIGPLGPKPALVTAGIAAAFAPGRNPAKP